jgi:phytoene dehydrogenase-like protein
MSRAIVIGAGVNGLACALRLALAGHGVTVLEAREHPGGMAGVLDLAEGFRAPFVAHLGPPPDPRIAALLGLAAPPAIATTALAADGAHRTVRGGGTDGPDAAAWAALQARLSAFAAALAPFRGLAPPRLKGPGNAWGSLLKTGLGLRRLGRGALRELLRLILTNAADVAEDELTDPLLQGLFAFDATLGAFAGPRSPNTLILGLNRLALGPLSAAGGPAALPAALVGALVGALKARGVALRTGARVIRIDSDGDRATGVTLVTGERIAADLIAAAIAPGPLLGDLVGPRLLDAGLFTAVRHIRARGTTAHLALALSAAPDFRGADLTHRLVIAPSVDAVEAAWNPAKYNEVPESPVMEITVPSAHAPGWAPAGAHVLTALVESAPCAPPDPEAARAALLEASLRVLEGHAPGLRRLVTAARLTLPAEIGETFASPGGNWHHAELSVEQMLFLRPLPQAPRYAMPLPGLWLAGAGAHPGGWVTGSAGWNAAEAMLRGPSP